MPAKIVDVQVSAIVAEVQVSVIETDVPIQAIIATFSFLAI